MNYLLYKEALFSKIHIWQGDITTCTTDAIVNAANKTLLGGGGVDGAIHAAAGPELLAACQKLNGCTTGEAKTTPGYKLPAAFVIHTVGPIYGHHNGKEKELLSTCYKSCLAQTRQYPIHSIAFPAISCGVYGYPPEEAARVALHTVSTELVTYPYVKNVLFVVFSDRLKEIYHTEWTLLKKEFKTHTGLYT